MPSPQTHFTVLGRILLASLRRMLLASTIALISFGAAPVQAAPSGAPDARNNAEADGLRIYLPLVSYEHRLYTGNVVGLPAQYNGAVMRMAYSSDGGQTYALNFDEAKIDEHGHFEFVAPSVGNGRQFYVYYPNEEDIHWAYRPFICNVVDSLDDRDYCNFDSFGPRVDGTFYRESVDPPLTLRVFDCGIEYKIQFYDHSAGDVLAYETDWTACYDENNEFNVTFNEFPDSMPLHHYYDYSIFNRTSFGVGKGYMETAVPHTFELTSHR